MNSPRPIQNHDEEGSILRGILNTAVDAIITIDSYGIIQSVNPAACEMFGYAEDELIAQNISILMPSPDKEQHDGYIRKYLKTGVAQIIGTGREVAAIRKSGEKIDVDLAVSEVCIGDRRLFTGILRDMTQRKQAEEAIAREKKFTQSLIDTASAAIVVLNPTGRIERINPYLEELTEQTSESVVGRDFFDVFHFTDNVEEIKRRFGEVYGGEPIQSLVSEVRTAVGGRRTFAWSARVLHDADEIREGVLVIGNDITELKQAEAQLIAQERLAAIGQMVTGLAHESRNALQRARACLDVLELDAEEDSQELIHRAQSALNELQRLYEEVRSYAAPLRLDTSLCNIVQLCKDTWENVAMLHENATVQLQLESEYAQILSRCDRDRIVQVLRNVLENAIAAAQDGSTIYVKCQRYVENNSPFVRISIKDEGPGLSLEQAEQIFTPFYTTKTKGTGLGLAISKRFVDAHGGRIFANNVGRAGAEIIVCFPAEDIDSD